MKKWTSITAFSFLCSCVGVVKSTPETTKDEEFVIVSHSARISPSGMLRTWIVLQSRSPSQGHIIMFVPNMTYSQFIPRKGSKCTIKYHKEIISGLSSEGAVVSDEPVVVVDRLECNTGRLQAA